MVTVLSPDQLVLSAAQKFESAVTATTGYKYDMYTATY